MDSIIITTDIMTADSGLDWLGDDPRHYDPLDRYTSSKDDCDAFEDLIDDDDQEFDAAGDRLPFE
ncbi:MAG: hypothetical protein AB8B85_23065 [Paracoccaceae bacterium]